LLFNDNIFVGCKDTVSAYVALSGEWEGDNNNIAFYKFFHASSSSGESQSLDKAFSLAKWVMILSFPNLRVVSSFRTSLNLSS
jgi:hypothetical protein